MELIKNSLRYLRYCYMCVKFCVLCKFFLEFFFQNKANNKQTQTKCTQFKKNICRCKNLHAQKNKINKTKRNCVANLIYADKRRVKKRSKQTNQNLKWLNFGLLCDTNSFKFTVVVPQLLFLIISLQFVKVLAWCWTDSGCVNNCFNQCGCVDDMFAPRIDEKWQMS